MSEPFTPDEAHNIWNMKRWIQAIVGLNGLDKLDPNDAVIAGGLFASFIQGDTPRDIDVFFLNKSFVIPYGAPSGFVKSEYQTGNPRIINVYNKKQNNIDFQFIVTDYKTREELIAGFDFKHCTMSYAGDTLYATPTAYRAAKTKTLIGNNETIKKWRIEKFVGRGYDWPKEEVKVIDTPNMNALDSDTQNPYANVIRQSMKQTFATIIQQALENYPLDNNTTK